jgi:hypothetical protein
VRERECAVINMMLAANTRHPREEKILNSAFIIVVAEILNFASSTGLFPSD